MVVDARKLTKSMGSMPSLWERTEALAWSLDTSFSPLPGLEVTVGGGATDSWYTCNVVR